MSDAFDQMKNMVSNNQTENQEKAQETVEKQFCENCGEEMPVGAKYCEVCGFVVGGSLDEYEEGHNYSLKLKNFIIGVGRFAMDFSVTLGIIATILCILFGLYLLIVSPKNSYWGDIHFGYVFLAAGLFMFLINVLSTYFYYILIDIRDSLKSIDEKTRRK